MRMAKLMIIACLGLVALCVRAASALEGDVKDSENAERQSDGDELAGRDLQTCGKDILDAWLELPSFVGLKEHHESDIEEHCSVFVIWRIKKKPEFTDCKRYDPKELEKSIFESMVSEEQKRAFERRENAMLFCGVLPGYEYSDDDDDEAAVKGSAAKEAASENFPAEELKEEEMDEAKKEMLGACKEAFLLHLSSIKWPEKSDSKTEAELKFDCEDAYEKALSTDMEECKEFKFMEIIEGMDEKQQEHLSEIFANPGVCPPLEDEYDQYELIFGFSFDSSSHHDSDSDLASHEGSLNDDVNKEDSKQ